MLGKLDLRRSTYYYNLSHPKPDRYADVRPLVREAFSLFQISELSVREIARITGATENLVKVRVHRAKQKLRELLADMAS